MGACRELNPYSCWACILMIRKPDDISAYLAQGYFQDYLKFLERRKLKLMQTAAHTATQEIFQELLPGPD
ncbi:hypothetical protein EO95_11180 [Methanosarcina sp. 1.H.T.1A.1]|uniref:hypothetical protein n=1 Tax=Methanosarcina sp. 1.H.T.1A.1 TaxID=1483602 RepID=UPI0006227200|nr:hypothetical protein [Methanosarcina sp. 1.H.T.1A.1]KKH92705.1 hypothetical protein EO95_11180 [Methanosarcina sp. 1.H.T.1A.1]